MDWYQTVANLLKHKKFPIFPKKKKTCFFLIYKKKENYKNSYSLIISI